MAKDRKNVDIDDEKASVYDRSSVEETAYPTGIKLLAITIALCLAVFLVALDQTIIATAIPRITDEFDSVQDIGWYGSVRST